MTFDLDLWPTDLNINRGHLLIKDYLSTKFEASGTKRSWVISCTRWRHDLWPLTYWPDYQWGSSTHQGLSTYQVWSFWGKAFLTNQLHKVKGYRHTDRPTDIPTDMCKAICPSFFEREHKNPDIFAPLITWENMTKISNFWCKETFITIVPISSKFVRSYVL